MAENSSSSELFSGRYKFQRVSNDWDRGRSGYTHLVLDTHKGRLGVIKRAEVTSKQAVEGLKNEVAALKALKGSGVPDVYDTGETEYGSKNYFYIVIEYIEGIRVEKKLDSLSTIERAKILTQLFDLLAKTHRMGVTNGDVDLKHLFWRQAQEQLVVIDWGNAKLNVELRRRAEFAYDLARAAEVIFSLVTRQGHPPATGSLALPEGLGLISGLEPLPPEFSDLCRWAPRTPSESATAPYTAQELFEASKRWLDALLKPEPKPVMGRPLRWIGLLALVGIGVLALLAGLQIFGPTISTVTPTFTSSGTPPPPTLTSSPSPTPTLTSTPTAVITPTSITPLVTPTYSSLLAFDRTRADDGCWDNQVLPPATPILNDGFFKRENKDWGFRVQAGHPNEDVIQVGFHRCFTEEKPIGAIALNVWILRLEVPAYEPAREFGIFLIGQDGRRREYTVWIDKDQKMYLRVRDGDTVKNHLVLVVSSNILESEGKFPRPFYKFPLRMFLQIDNNGSDILYLFAEPVQESVKVEDIDPSLMIPIEDAKLPTLGDIQDAGLIGYGGKTEVLIWPLVFLENMSR